MAKVKRTLSFDKETWDALDKVAKIHHDSRSGMANKILIAGIQTIEEFLERNPGYNILDIYPALNTKK